MMIISYKGTWMVKDERRLKRITSDLNKLEKFRLNFSRCANCDTASWRWKGDGQFSFRVGG